MHKSRSEQIYDHVLRYATPFHTTTGHAWAIVPNGPLRQQAHPLHSAYFREWLAQTFLNDHGLYPGCHALYSAIAVLAANARFTELSASQIFTRLGHTGPAAEPEFAIVRASGACAGIVRGLRHGIPLRGSTPTATPLVPPSPRSPKSSSDIYLVSRLSC